MKQHPHMLPKPSAVQPGTAGLLSLLRSKGVPAVDWKGWLHIDAEEIRRGKTCSKPREKLVDVDEMLAVAEASPMSDNIS